MHFAPRNACETQYFNKAMSQFQMMLKAHPQWAEIVARYNGKVPGFMMSAVKQHALYYAADMCRGNG